MRLVALNFLFKLLDLFSKERNPFAPIIYKTIVFSLVENHSDFQTREFVMANFTKLLVKIPSIPIGILIEPIAK